MNDYSFIASWASKATWSIREAAYLVNKLDPMLQEIEISETSFSPVSKVFYWLKKEYKRGKLYRVGGTDEEPRFSPGSLLRDLNSRGSHICKIPDQLWHNYHEPEKVFGPHKINLQSVPYYRGAALAIWSIHSHLTKPEVADMLTNLPKLVSDIRLAPWSAVTIANHLKGLSPNKAGRPPKKSGPVPKIDLAEILKNKSDWKIGLDC